MQKESKKETFHNWHPNLRLADKLPDIKVVRTGFMVNLIAVIVVILLLGLNVQRELSIYSTGSELAKLEEQIESQTAQNDKNLRLSTQFKRYSKMIEDLETFYGLSYPPLEFLLPVIQNRPENVTFVAFRYTIEYVGTSKKTQDAKDFAGNFIITGYMNGSTPKEIAAVSAYRDALEQMEPFKDKVIKASVTTSFSNKTENIHEFQIEVLVKS